MSATSTPSSPSKNRFNISPNRFPLPKKDFSLYPDPKGGKIINLFGNNNSENSTQSPLHSYSPLSSYSPSLSPIKPLKSRFIIYNGEHGKKFENYYSPDSNISNESTDSNNESADSNNESADSNNESADSNNESTDDQPRCFRKLSF